MLFQDVPAQTTGYMLLGYAVIFGSMLIYLISLVLRRKNLKQDLEILSVEENQGESNLNSLSS